MPRSRLGAVPLLVSTPQDLITGTMERMAWRSSRKFERGVVCEKGAVAKKAVFSLTNIGNRKRAFNLCNPPTLVRNRTFLHLNFFGRLTLLWAHLGGTLSKLFLKRSGTKTLVRWP